MQNGLPGIQRFVEKRTLVTAPWPEVERAAAVALARFTRPDEVDAMVELVQREDTTPWQRRLLPGRGEGGCSAAHCSPWAWSSR